jgi:hypothetical protein
LDKKSVENYSQRHQMIRIETRINALQQDEALHQQTGPDQKDQRQRNLSDHQGAPQSRPPREPPGTPLPVSLTRD